MQQRLVEIGNWLAVNGDAIYNTRAFIRNKDDERINPAANKSIFFTKKARDLYIICLEWPRDNIVLRGIGTGGTLKADMPGKKLPVNARNSGGNIIITPPRLNPDDYQPAYVFRLSNILTD
jgi:alpha-L-fucosidase